ncbi:hypothetical protein M9H77_29970 [Catharanthus roseus]|uniref:Uncharacterized protein n=1 Tax=Catharanthus roseus TaxID=4058 RepID=A0ACB9ZVY2_CATRO|nr:hypothetical protein M9H77_29970 [Catharanthus roseus]
MPLFDNCEEIFEGLLQQGRLPLSEIINGHKQTSSTQGNCSTEAVLESFYKLVNARFVERCPAPEPFLEPPAEDETRAKKQGAKNAKVSEVPQAVEQCALAAVAPLESMRFLVEMDTWSDISEKTNEEQPNDGRVGEKIADATFVDKKDAIKILYKLWKDDYLQMEKITIGGARLQLSLWKVNEEALHGHVPDEMYHGALNLRL